MRLLAGGATWEEGQQSGFVRMTPSGNAAPVSLELSSGLGPPVLFGAAVYAATERGETGSWAALTLLLFVLPAVEVARFRASFGLWVR